MKIVVGPLKPRDSKVAAGLLRTILLELTFYPKERNAADLKKYTPGNISRYMKNRHTIFLGAWAGKNLAGLLFGFAYEGGLGYVDWVVVGPGYRKMGIAERLVKRAEQIAKRKGMHKMWWDTEISNKKMIAFNRKMKYAKVATLRDWYYHNTDTLWAKKL